MDMFKGIWPALVTPLAKDGSIDAQAAERLIEALIATGIGGLYVCGGTGEGVLLQPEQRRQMAEAAVRATAGRVPVMVHVGTTDTRTAMDLARHASRIGADAVSAVPPFYYAYQFEAIKEHYRAITTAASVPVYMYYIPVATGVNMSAEEILGICSLDGMHGLKYTCENLGVLGQLMAMRDPDNVNVLSGPDPLFLACLALGVEGAIGTTYNFMPRVYVDIMGSLLAGELSTAQRLQRSAVNLIDALRNYGVLPGTKALLGSLGFPVGDCVPPMPTISGEMARQLRNDLDVAGLNGLLKRNAIYGPGQDAMRGRLA